MSGTTLREGLPSRLLRAWDGFWFAEGSSLALGLFRILFAGCLWRLVSSTRSKSVFAIEGGFHLPYLEWIPLVSEPSFQWIHTLQYPLILLFGLGLLTRPAGTLLLVLQGYVFFADQLNFRNHPYFFLLVLLLLVLSPCDDALSVRSLVRAWRNGRPWSSALLGSVQPLSFQRLIQTQLAILYLYSGLHKLSAGFLSGYVLSHQMQKTLVSEVQGWLGNALTPDGAERIATFAADPSNWIAPAIATALLELSLPFLLFWRRTRTGAMLAGIPFHLGIALLMNIWTFSLAVIATYLLFLDPGTLPRLCRRARALPPAAAPGEGATGQPSDRASALAGSRSRGLE